MPEFGLWDVTTRKFIGLLSTGNEVVLHPVVFSPDGRRLATGSNDGVILWDVATRQPLGHLHLGTDNYLSSLAFSPDGKTLAIGHDVDVTLWDTTSPGSSGQSLKAEQALTESLAYSPDGKMLAVGDALGSLFILDVKTQRFTKLAGGLDVIDDIAFSPDGRVLASTSRDGKILLWDAKSWQMISPAFILPTHAMPTTLSYSPNGKLLASGNYDNSINLWDVASRQLIGQGLSGNTWPVDQVAFSPDGNILATASNKIILWDMNPQSWVEKICQRVGRNLTRSEWAQYLPGETYRATCPQRPLEPVATPTPVATP
jgi:WD40 repeat protein